VSYRPRLKKIPGLIRLLLLLCLLFVLPEDQSETAQRQEIKRLALVLYL